MNKPADKSPAEPVASIALLLHADDNVATALQALVGGQTVQLQGADGRDHAVLLREPIGLCHKFALCEIAQGDMVRKYGEAIGLATKVVHAGEHVHIHNLRSSRAT